MAVRLIVPPWELEIGDRFYCHRPGGSDPAKSVTGPNARKKSPLWEVTELPRGVKFQEGTRYRVRVEREPYAIVTGDQGYTVVETPRLWNWYFWEWDLIELAEYDQGVIP